jgi:hypothetical protein
VHRRRLRSNRDFARHEEIPGGVLASNDNRHEAFLLRFLQSDATPGGAECAGVLTTTRPRRLTRPSPAGHIKYANTPGAPNSRDGTVRPLAAHDDQPCPRRRRHRTASRPPQAHDLGRKKPSHKYTTNPGRRRRLFRRKAIPLAALSRAGGGSTRSENHGMYGTSMCENREIPSSPAGVIAGRAAQGRPRP